MYILNLQKEPDGFYHIHTLNCSNRPLDNFIPCDGTIQQAVNLLQGFGVVGVASSNVKYCNICLAR